MPRRGRRNKNTDKFKASADVGDDDEVVAPATKGSKEGGELNKKRLSKDLRFLFTRTSFRFL